MQTSLQLLLTAFISTSTANCFHQYSYCIVRLLQDNCDYLLPAAFISTFTAYYIHQYIYCQVHSSVHLLLLHFQSVHLLLLHSIGKATASYIQSLNLLRGAFISTTPFGRSEEPEKYR